MSDKPVELYRQYRPENFKQVIGQDEAIRVLCDLGKRKAIPHSLLLTGPSGVGKTTIARILRTRLDCSDTDYEEINAAENRGIDNIREIQARWQLAAMGGKTRVWCIDEAHRLTPDAQSALLKMLEDTPSHVYFFLATTDPQKLLNTIRTRCTEIALKSLSPSKLEELVVEVAKREDVELDEEVVDSLVEASEGSARKSLVLLHSLIGIEDTEKQLEAITSADSRAGGVEICKALMKNAKWPTMSKILKSIDGLNEQAESIRRMILGWMASVALGGGKGAARAVEIIQIFERNFYDSGRAGLIAACYEAVVGE